MYGAILGDIVGSTYELHNVKTEQFELFPSWSTFTDDTVLSVAVAAKILNEDKANMNARKSYLQKAYDMAGEHIFKGDGEKYLKLVINK